MVSFWPWKAADASPASFEKALAGLAAKISETQARLDRMRSTSRRVRVLATLYLTFAYLVYAIVLVLVVGWRNLGAWEWTGMAGGPVGIYATRTALAAYYNLRIEAFAGKLKDHQSEREKTIQQLKDATKYDSTLELLEKYGGDSKRKGRKTDGPDLAGPAGPGGQDCGPAGLGKSAPRQPSPAQPIRTNLPPPPTANIRRTPDADEAAEFAPNAFGLDEPDASAAAPPHLRQRGIADQEILDKRLHSTHGLSSLSPSTSQYVSAAFFAPHWYDRLLDLLMGEDETAARNRLVLICRTCRLVNGQAPPGMHTVAEVGPWRCMGCGTMNEMVDAEAEARLEEARPKAKTVGKTVRGSIGDSASDTGTENDAVFAQIKTEAAEPSRDVQQRFRRQT